MDIGIASKGGPKLPPESLFNLDEDRSIKTIHQRNEINLPPWSNGSQPAQKKSASEIVQLTSSDEDSASSSSIDGLHSTATKGVEISPPSSAEGTSQALLECFKNCFVDCQ